MNILAGSLYGTILGLPMVLFLTAIGSSFTYLLSKHLLGSLIFGKLIPISSLANLRSRVESNRSHMLLFMIAIRFVPLVPGGVVSVSSPFLKIPLPLFFISTFLGVLPYAFICVSSASTLSSLNSVSDIFNFWVICKLVLIFSIIIIPIALRKTIYNWLDGKDQPNQVPLEVVKIEHLV